MAKFVIADVTQARWMPHELKGFVESNPSIAVIPFIASNVDVPYDKTHWPRYSWVLELREYKNQDHAIELLRKAIPLAEAKVEEQRWT